MRARSCTIDSSCVIALDHLKLMPSLSLLFSKVLVPRTVRKELYKRRETKDRLRWLFKEYAFFQRCDHYDQGAVDLLLTERSRDGSEDRSEAEAVVQASQVGAVVTVDDPWGRALAERFELEFHGTLWVLQQFQKVELLSSVALRDCFSSLRARGVRLPWDVVNELLLKIGQPML
jgi:predicted nucleic acid-binding protein